MKIVLCKQEFIPGVQAHRLLNGEINAAVKLHRKVSQ